MRLADKKAATEELLSISGVPQALRDLCQKRLDACGETYENSRDIEDRVVRDEIDEELADAINIAAMGNRAGRFGSMDMSIVRRHVVRIWEYLHPDERDDHR